MNRGNGVLAAVGGGYTLVGYTIVAAAAAVAAVAAAAEVVNYVEDSTVCFVHACVVQSGNSCAEELAEFRTFAFVFN